MIAERSRAAGVRIPVPTGAAPSSASDWVRSRRRAWIEGKSAQATMAASVAAVAASPTRQSSVMSARRGKSAGRIAGSRPTRNRAPAMPRRPPVTPTTMLSVSHWRARRAALAPSAERRAISRRRLATRANCTTTTLAIAVVKSRRTAASITRMAGRTSATATSRAGMAMIVGGSPLPKSASADAPGSRATRARAVPSAVTCAAVTPGRIRAMAPKICSEIRSPPSLNTGAM